MVRSREDQDKYRGDVIYDVWLRGGNPDRVDYDRVQEDFYEGLTPEASAKKETYRQKPKNKPLFCEEEYYQQEHPEDYPIEE